MQIITAQKITPEAFAPFGQLIDKDGGEKIAINNGKCIRHHDITPVELSGPNSKPLINIFEGQAYPLPHLLNMVERHPLGSQAFIPMHDRPFLVTVCQDIDGKPGIPHAFITKPNQGINIRMNVWHGVLTPLQKNGDFLVIDRGGDGDNLEECFFEKPFSVEVDPKLF